MRVEMRESEEGDEVGALVRIHKRERPLLVLIKPKEYAISLSSSSSSPPLISFLLPLHTYIHIIFRFTHYCFSTFVRSPYAHS